MPELPTLFLFALASLAMTATPGPDMLLIATRSAAQGRSAGLATFCGIAAGTYCHALAVALGLSQLFLMMPIAYDVVRFAGASYLLYLAWKSFRSIGKVSSIGQSDQARKTLTMFRQGFLTNILNPKMMVFSLALFPQFISPASGDIISQVLILATILNLVGFLVNGSVILTASKAAGMLSADRRLNRFAQILLGTVFAGLAMRLMLEERR